MEYWFLLPLGALVAILAMSSGIAGSNFWIPIYLLWLELPPRVAFWVSLITMLFGFGSGLWRNLRARTLDFRLAGRYLGAAVPAGAIGAWLSTRLDVGWLLVAFAAFALAYGLLLLVAPQPPPADAARRRPGWPWAGLGGLLQGLLATGAGVLVLPAMLRERRIHHHAVAVGSTVAVVLGASLVSALLRLDGNLLAALADDRQRVVEILLFAVPGVVVGGQVGPRLAGRLPRAWLRRYVGALLVVVAFLVGLRGVAS